jgi:TetR/AcrR family transcriptional regulator of autoinduction and epiphytic fitness
VAANSRLISSTHDARDYNPRMSRLSFREQVLRVREDAIISSVNRLLADKGFDLMTVDEVAADVGIAKASLYKHFASKEALAAAAMVRLLQTALTRVEDLDSHADLTPLQRLQAVTRWLLEVQLAGEMPTLPSQNSSLRAELMASRPYMDALMQASDILGAWIVQAQADGQINPGLPPEVVLYTVFARACDPVPAFLKAAGQHSDKQIVDWVMSTCFEGLNAVKASQPAEPALT